MNYNKIKYFFIVISLYIVNNVWSQNNDTCNCRLIYGHNWLDPVLTTYYNDSFVAYQSGYPNEKGFEAIKRKVSLDSLFTEDNFRWKGFYSEFLIRNKNFGKKLENEFYIFRPWAQLKKDSIFKTFYIAEQIIDKKVYNFLYTQKISVDDYDTINRFVCNCFTSDRFVYHGDYEKINLSRDSLLIIPLSDNWNTEINHIFLWDDYCSLYSKECFLPGIGMVKTEDMFGRMGSTHITYLDKNCKSYFKRTFNIDIN